jgi:hypothetical protein
MALCLQISHTLNLMHQWCNGNFLTSSVVDHGFQPLSDHIKDYQSGIFCFFAQHAALRSKNQDWLAHNQDNVAIDFSEIYIYKIFN